MSRAGKFRHQALVEKPQETGKDDRGQPEINWQVSRYWMCSINRLSGRQLEIARQVYTDATHEVVGRWFPGLVELDRLRFDNRLFHIREIDNVEEINREYRLTVAEDRT